MTSEMIGTDEVVDVNVENPNGDNFGEIQQ